MTGPTTPLLQALNVDEAEMGALAAMRERMRPLAAEQGVRLTFLPFLIKAAAIALAEHHTLNATLDPQTGTIHANDTVNVGIPVDTAGGPVTPVLHHVERLSLLEVARAIARLAESARADTLADSDRHGATFTVSNTGSVGGLFTAPVVLPPEVAIVGVNQIIDRAVVRDGAVVARPMMYVSTSYDRRAVDGAEAARFTTTFIRLIETPDRLMLQL